MTSVEEARELLGKAEVRLQKAEDELKAFQSAELEGQWLNDLRRKFRAGTITNKEDRERHRLEKEEKRLKDAVETAGKEKFVWAQAFDDVRRKNDQQTQEILPFMVSSSADSAQVKRRKLDDDYKRTVRAGQSVGGPSSGAKPKEFREKQQKDPTVYNGRPFERTGPPIALYNEIFGRFIQELNDENLVMTADHYKWTEDFMFTASELYDSEDDRLEAVHDKLATLLGPIQTTTYGKKKILAQTGALYYQGYWSQDRTSAVRERCCCPSFILAMAGPWLCVLGGVYTNVVIVEPLTDFVSLLVKPRDGDQLGRIARIFEALQRALDRLDEFYGALDMTSLSDEQRFFPYHRSYKDASNVNHTFTYHSPLTDDCKKPLWRAQTEDGGILV
ncbi:11044_t:CDS:2, partial [Paraglomus occultum]